jgi:hypothetical protein
MSVVHYDKLKPYKGEPLRSWLTQVRLAPPLVEEAVLTKEVAMHQVDLNNDGTDIQIQNQPQDDEPNDSTNDNDTDKPDGNHNDLPVGDTLESTPKVDKSTSDMPDEDQQKTQPLPVNDASQRRYPPRQQRQRPARYR